MKPKELFGIQTLLSAALYHGEATSWNEDWQLISWSTGKEKTSAMMATGFHKLMVIDYEALYS